VYGKTAFIWGTPPARALAKKMVAGMNPAIRVDRPIICDL
jgi:hypothetical protein